MLCLSYKSVVKWFVMGHLVRLVVGVWEQVGNRGWLFLEDPTERKYDVMVHENQTYASLMDLVRTRYSVATETAVGLTFEFPEWMKIPGDVSNPPVDVKDDGDVDLFMSMRLEIQDLRLLVTIGNNVVARYLFQRRDKYTVIGSSAGSVAPNLNPYHGFCEGSALNQRRLAEKRGDLMDGVSYWDSILGQGMITKCQQFLVDVCSGDDTPMLREPPLTQERSPYENAMEISDGTESSTDSSANPLNAAPQIAGSGIIRLSDGSGPTRTNQNRALIIGTVY